MNSLDAVLAQKIVERTMEFIPFNVNVMNKRGTIIASGNPSRIGQVHSGAQQALAQQCSIEIDETTARKRKTVRPGINLPLRIRGQAVGVVGLTGDPVVVRQFAELVRVTAEMILEQFHLIAELQRETGYREEFLSQAIRQGTLLREELEAWAIRLNINFEHPCAIVILDVTEEGIRPDDSLAALKRVQSRLSAERPESLSAAISPRELILLEAIDAQDANALPERAALHLSQLDALLRKGFSPTSTLSMGVALTGIEGIPISYQSARRTARVGRLRKPDGDLFSFYDLSLPVLLAGLSTGWQAEHLRRPLDRLQAVDRQNSVLRQTLEAWFANHSQPGETAKTMKIHRNTLDYRLRQISEATGLNLENTDDRLLLYIALQLE